MPCWDHKAQPAISAGCLLCGPFPTPCRFATSPFQGECGRSLLRLPVPPGRRFAPTCGTAPDGAIARLRRAPFVPLAGHRYPPAPPGDGGRDSPARLRRPPSVGLRPPTTSSLRPAPAGAFSRSLSASDAFLGGDVPGCRWAKMGLFAYTALFFPFTWAKTGSFAYWNLVPAVPRTEMAFLVRGPLILPFRAPNWPFWCAE